jgi:GAF domain-containing protein
MPADGASLTESRLRGLFRDAPSREEGIRRVVEAIHESRSVYTWTGVYLLDGTELVLAHQIGKPTPHSRISLDKGICGAAAREGETIIVDDVNEDPRYLACTPETRSEIVVPLTGACGKVLGEIDIDSDLPAAFDGGDRATLELAARILSEFLERVPPSPAPGSRAAEPPGEEPLPSGEQA